MKYLLSILAATAMLGTYTSAQMATSHVPSAAPTAQTPQPKSGMSTSLLNATGKPVVKVNGAVLTDRDLMHELFVIFPYAEMHNGIPKNMEPEMRRGAMDMIIFDELVYQEALRRKITVPETKYEASHKNFMKQFPDDKAFHLFLAQECKGSPQEFRRRLMRSLLIEALVKQEIKEKAKLSDLQLRRYYTQNPAKFDHPESISFQSISIIPPANASPDVKAQARTHAEKLLKQAKATKNYDEFGLLAEKESDDDFHVNMGLHKSVPVAQLPPDIVKPARAMKAGDVSDLISMGPNFTIFRLNTHTNAGRASFEESKAKLRVDLEKERTEQLRKTLYRKLRSTAKIQEL